MTTSSNRPPKSEPRLPTSIHKLLAWAEVRQFFHCLCGFGLAFRMRQSSHFFRLAFPPKRMDKCATNVLTRLADEGFLQVHKSVVVENSLLDTEPVRNLGPQTLKPLRGFKYNNPPLGGGSPKADLLMALGEKSWPDKDNVRPVKFYAPTKEAYHEFKLGEPVCPLSDDEFKERMDNSGYKTGPHAHDHQTGAFKAFAAEFPVKVDALAEVYLRVVYRLPDEIAHTWKVEHLKESGHDFLFATLQSGEHRTPLFFGAPELSHLPESVFHRFPVGFVLW